MGRTGGGSRGQPSCPGPAQCVPGQGPSAGQPGTRSCPGQRTWASLVHRRGPQWGGRPQCAQLGLSFRELETGAVYGDREQEVPPDSQGRGPEVVGDQWNAVLRQDLGSVPGTARATSPCPVPEPPALWAQPGAGAGAWGPQASAQQRPETGRATQRRKALGEAVMGEEWASGLGAQGRIEGRGGRHGGRFRVREASGMKTGWKGRGKEAQMEEPGSGFTPRAWCELRSE